MAFENNLLFLFFVLLGLAALAGLGFALWKPVGRRAWSYLRLWWQQDKLSEAQAKVEAQARKQARRELAEACGDELPADETAQEAAAQIKNDSAPSAPRPLRLSKDKPKPAEAQKISLIKRR